MNLWKQYCNIYFQDVVLRGRDLPMSFPPNYFDAFIDVVHYEDTPLPHILSGIFLGQYKATIS